MLFMVRSGTISVVVVALLCMSCIILCQCVERGKSKFQKWGPVIVRVIEVGTQFEWGTIIEWKRSVTKPWCTLLYIYSGGVSVVMSGKMSLEIFFVLFYRLSLFSRFNAIIYNIVEWGIYLCWVNHWIILISLSISIWWDSWSLC